MLRLDLAMVRGVFPPALRDAELGIFLEGGFLEIEGTSPPCLPEERGDKDWAPGVDLGASDCESGGFCGELDGALEACAAAGDNPAVHTRPEASAKRKNLRNPTTTLNYRRKLPPRRETSSSARLRISS